MTVNMYSRVLYSALKVCKEPAANHRGLVYKCHSHSPVSEEAQVYENLCIVPFLLCTFLFPSMFQNDKPNFHYLAKEK